MSTPIPSDPTTPRPRRLAAAVAAALTVTGLAPLIAATPAGATTPRPDLGVKAVKVDKATIAEGAELAVTHVVSNTGTTTARATVTRFYLSRDVRASLAERRASRTSPRSSLTDILLEGSAAVGSVKPGRSASIAATKVVVPVGTPPATYTLLACADDHGQVKESDEADNCTPAGSTVQVEAAPGSDTLSVQTFSESRQWPEDEDSALHFIKLFCNGVHPVRSYTLPGAISSIRTELEKLAPGGLAKVEDSTLAGTPEDAQELAATAVTQGSPGLALAALLRAYELQPSRGSHLVNAAALATSIGLPNQAIALLDGAVGKDFLRQPLGIPHEATAAVIRGQALVMTGRYDAAQRLFVQAKQLAPILSEADTGLATVAACKGQDAVAKRYIARSRVRSDDPVPPTPPTEDPVQPTPDIDVTRGEAVPLRQLPIAETPAQAAAMRPVYYGIADGFQAEIQANIDETNQIEQHLRETDESRTRAEIERRDGILVLLYRTHLDADVENAQQAFFDKLDELTVQNEEFWGGGTGELQSVYGGIQEDASNACRGAKDYSACFTEQMHSHCRPALTSAHIQWRTTILAAQDLANTYFRIWSKKMTGFAANLIDEEAHRLALLHIDGLERDVYALLVQQAQFWSHNVNLHRDYCVDPLPPEVLDAPADADVESPGACEAGLKALSLKASLGPTSVKINCERVEQSFSQEVIPLLHVFVDVKFDYRTGNVSVWAGSKGGGKVGNVVDAGFKSGWYVKVNQQGELVDTGWRVGPNLKVVGGNAEFGVYKDEIDLSITSSTNPGY